jgi:arylsulfatase A-like enzyme
MTGNLAFRSAVITLWSGLTGAAIATLAFVEIMLLASGKAQGWSFYITGWEIAYETTLRLVLAGFAGIAIASILTALLAPALWFLPAWRQRLINIATTAAAFVAVVLSSYCAARMVTQSFIQMTHHGQRTARMLMIAYGLGLAAAIVVPRTRRALLRGLDIFMRPQGARLMAGATVCAAAALAIFQYAAMRTMPSAEAAVTSKASSNPKLNILLVTFDALSAEDMSLYGSSRPTTPNIDAFAKDATVFTNFYSASTFTTPSVASIVTGLYPSQHHVHQLRGRAIPKDAAKNAFHAMRNAGYATGAYISNPWAYYYAETMSGDYNVLKAPVFEPGGMERLWQATGVLHRDLRLANRADEYFDLALIWNSLAGKPGDEPWRVRPEPAFDGARKAIAEMPDGYFFWVHVLAPHDPYLPDTGDRGRFLHLAKGEKFDADDSWSGRYQPAQQPSITQHRMHYDEYIASADRAFGVFMRELEDSGKLRNTAVIVSADHGESFEGGVYRHKSSLQTRPMIHVPLIVRTPGQQEGRRVAFAADQTAIAPLILELAGVARPSWMRGESLTGWLQRDGGQGQGLAFCEYLERNSIFRPVRYGTAGVIDGEYQYVMAFPTRKGVLRALDAAQNPFDDHTGDQPARADSMRAAILARFPEFGQATQ